MSEQGGAGLLTLTGRPQGAVAEQGAPAEVGERSGRCGLDQNTEIQGHF